MKQHRSRKQIADFAEFLLRWRIPIILLIVIIAGASAYYFNKIPRDPSVEAMVLEDDPDLQAYNKFKEIFGNDEFVLLATKVRNIFAESVMRDVEALREKIETVEYIKDVTTYTNIRTVHGQDDSIVVEEMIPAFPKNAEESKALRERALLETDYIGNLYSQDGTTLAILARLVPLKGEEDSTETRSAITSGIRKLCQTEPFNRYDWKVGGTPVLKTDLAETQRKESTKFQLIIFAMLSVLLFVIFRTLGGVFVTLGAVQAGVFMLMAGHYFSGIPLTMVSTILTPLMLIYGVSSSVHIQTHYALRTAGNLTKRQALIGAVAATLIPCFFNSTTTAVGFGSNLVSAIKPIREFGMFASSGIILSLILSFLLVPTLLSFLPAPGKATHKAHESGLRVYALEFIIKLTQRYRWLMIGSALVLLAISIYGMSLIRVETKLLDYFRPESPIRSSYTFIDENLSGISSMEIMIDTKTRGGMKDPEVIAKVDELTTYLQQEEKDTTSVLSLGNFYKRINMALHGDDPAWRKVPTTRQEAAQFLLLYSMSAPEGDLFDFVSSDYRYGRISTRIRTLSSAQLQVLVERIKTKTHEIFAPIEHKGVAVNVTGSVVLYANMNSSLVMGQFKSFSLSLLLISIMMILVAGEIGLGIVSLLPNLMPIALTMGFMGFAGYALDSTTAMVAPIALGMAVDSTIHFMVRFRTEYLESGDYELAAAQTVRIIGRAMIGTSIPLAFGFLVLVTSEFMPVMVFGLLSGIVVFLAMIFDLILTPICMALYKPSYRKRGLIDLFE